jgi:hypothetical protein
MNRRDFIATGLVSGASAVAASNVAFAGASGAEPAHKFKLNYGVVGMEHGLKDNKTKENEMACIQAYVSCDNFEIDGQ